MTAGAHGATIAGGGLQSWPNRVHDNLGAVGGGWGNQAGQDDGDTNRQRFATVGGGWSNTASGDISTVAGGISSGDDW